MPYWLFFTWSYTPLPPCYNLRSRRCCININKNVLLNKQVLHVNLSIFIFAQSNLKQSTEIHLRRTITKGLVANDGIDSWAVTVYEWEIGIGDWKKNTQKKTRKKERSLKWKSATNSLKMLPFHKAILRVIFVSSLLWKGWQLCRGRFHT